MLNPVLLRQTRIVPKSAEGSNMLHSYTFARFADARRFSGDQDSRLYQWVCSKQMSTIEHRKPLGILLLLDEERDGLVDLVFVSVNVSRCKLWSLSIVHGNWRVSQHQYSFKMNSLP